MNPVLQSRYGFHHCPFTKEVPIQDLFFSQAMTQGMERLKAALTARVSAVLIGDSGTGKTCILRALEAQVQPNRFRFSYTCNSALNLRDFYRQLALLLGLEPKASLAALFRQVNSHFEETALAQKVHPVLLLDEAHILNVHILSQLHILLNFQWDSAPLLSVILIGLPMLRDQLHRQTLASLPTRLPVRVLLPPLNAQEIAKYIRHRLKLAGCEREIFGEEAILLIAEASGGVMRKIDVLASTALEVGLDSHSSVIEMSIVKKALTVCGDALL